MAFPEPSSASSDFTDKQVNGEPESTRNQILMAFEFGFPANKINVAALSHINSYLHSGRQAESCI